MSESRIPDFRSYEEYQAKRMKPNDRYHKWIEWSEEDGVYLGKCPDLITGIHGDDPVRLYAELCDVVDEVMEHFEKEGRALPPSRTRPIQERS